MNDSNPRILVVDDEAPIRRFLHLTLTGQAYAVSEAATGQEALAAAVTYKPDVIVLDLGLPDMDGTEVIRLIREWTKIPIIVLSVRGAEGDKIAALDAGADDYLTKPFSAGELLARLRAALRRVNQIDGEPVLTAGELIVDLSKRQVTLSGEEVLLTPTEYDLLRLLVTHADRVITQRQILKEVWGHGYEQEYHILHVNMSNLRRKIEPDPTRPQFIITEPGVGYRLKLN
jgi:two-component system, OmpR family, KDP operon response regulator KdpE